MLIFLSEDPHKIQNCLSQPRKPVLSSSSASLLFFCPPVRWHDWGQRVGSKHLNCNQYRLGIQYPFFMYLIHLSYTFFGIQYCKPPKYDTSRQSHDVSFLHQGHFFLTHTTIISRSLFYACIFSHCISLNSLAIDSKFICIQLQSHWTSN
jgi:hypothetical protein